MNSTYSCKVRGNRVYKELIELSEYLCRLWIDLGRETVFGVILLGFDNRYLEVSNYLLLI